MKRRLIVNLLMLACWTAVAVAQHVKISGIVTDEDSKQPVEFASLLLKDNGQWAITGSDGRFTIKSVPTGKAVLTIQCLGYATRTITLNITKDIPRLQIQLKQESLKLDEVTVTAKRKRDEATTSYSIDRTTLDNQQVLNVSDIAALLPGGRTVNPSLMTDARLALRSGDQWTASAWTIMLLSARRLARRRAPSAPRTSSRWRWSRVFPPWNMATCRTASSR